MSSLSKTPTSWHIHVPIKKLLRYGDKRLGEIITHPKGVGGARAELRQMRAEGQEFLVCDSSCNNRKPDGSCAGHQVEEEDA